MRMRQELEKHKKRNANNVLKAAWKLRTRQIHKVGVHGLCMCINDVVDPAANRWLGLIQEYWTWERHYMTKTVLGNVERTFFSASYYPARYLLWGAFKYHSDELVTSTCGHDRVWDYLSVSRCPCGTIPELFLLISYQNFFIIDN